MSEKEVELKELLDRQLEGKITVSEIAIRLKKSERQILRRKKDYVLYGVGVIESGGCGSN